MGEILTKEFTILDLFAGFWRQKLLILVFMFIGVGGAFIIAQTVKTDVTSKILLVAANGLKSKEELLFGRLKDYTHEEDFFKEWLRGVGSSNLNYSKHLKNYTNVKGIRFAEDSAISFHRPYVSLKLTEQDSQIDESDFYRVLRSLLAYLKFIDSKILVEYAVEVEKEIRFWSDMNNASEVGNQILAETKLRLMAIRNTDQIFKFHIERPEKSLSLISLIFFGATFGLFAGFFVALLRFDPKN